MTSDKFNKIVEEQMDRCKSVLLRKKEEYNVGAEDDRLSHFKKVANLIGEPQNYAVFTMMAKHLVSISDMCVTEDTYDMDRWNEKITDAINYLCILRASVEEGKEQELEELTSE